MKSLFLTTLIAFTFSGCATQMVKTGEFLNQFNSPLTFIPGIILVETGGAFKDEDKPEDIVVEKTGDMVVEEVVLTAASEN